MHYNFFLQYIWDISNVTFDLLEGKRLHQKTKPIIHVFSFNL